MRIESVPIFGVTVGPRSRPVDPEKVAEIAESIKRVGLLQPITVYAPDNVAVELVAGRHRLEAVKSLGWEHIDAICVVGDKIERELVEISENLHRADLTKEQRDEHLRRYAELLEGQAQKVVPQNAAKPKSELKGGRPKSIAKKIAEQTGLSDDTVRRALNPKPAKPAADPFSDEITARKQYTRLVRAWDAAGAEVRHLFRSLIDLRSRLIDFDPPTFLVRVQPPAKE